MPAPNETPVETLPFVVGQTYVTKGGKSVKVIDEKYKDDMPDYWCIQGDDGIWRYNRAHDRGRATASNFDMSCPNNLVPLTK